MIPLFISALEAGEPPEIHGDGHQSRDFTYIADVVAANLRAADAAADRCSGLTFNVAGGRPYSLLELLDILSRITGRRVEPRFTSPRPGDVRHTLADISATETGIGYRPEVPFEEGLRRTVAWFREAWANAARAQAATGATGRGA